MNHFMDRITLRVCELGLQQTVLAAMPRGHQACCVTNEFQARIAFDCADFATASAAWTRLFPIIKFQDQSQLHIRLLEQAVIDRIGKAASPDLRPLIERFIREGAMPCYTISARWLAGEVAWEDALAEASVVEWGDELWFVRGIYHLTIGEHDAARADLAKVASEHPDWNERWTCEALLRWYATQTPESLAARPRAAVIPPIAATGRPHPAAPPATGDNF